MIDYFGFADEKYGGKFSVFVVLFLHIMINISTSSMSLYLAHALSNFDDKNDAGIKQSGSFTFTLIVIVIFCFATTVVGKYISSLIFMSINRNIHSKVIQSLIYTKMSFYDENTSGRILNRLSSDIACVEMIVFNFLEMIDYIIKCLFSVVFIIFSSPITVFVVAY
jgi:ABC-type multidrug transport system fused ATPase/permease subunit